MSHQAGVVMAVQSNSGVVATTTSARVISSAQALAQHHLSLVAGATNMVIAPMVALMVTMMAFHPAAS